MAKKRARAGVTIPATQSPQLETQMDNNEQTTTTTTEVTVIEQPPVVEPVVNTETLPPVLVPTPIPSPAPVPTPVVEDPNMDAVDPLEMYMAIAPWSPAISERLFHAFSALITVATTEHAIMKAQQTIHAEIVRVFVDEPQDRVNVFMFHMLNIFALHLQTTFNPRNRLREANAAFTPLERDEYCALINLFCDLANPATRKIQLAKFKWSSFGLVLLPSRHDAILTKMKNYFGVR